MHIIAHNLGPYWLFLPTCEGNYLYSLWRPGQSASHRCRQTTPTEQ